MRERLVLLLWRSFGKLWLKFSSELRRILYTTDYNNAIQKVQVMKTFADRLKEARGTRSQAEMAYVIGTTQATYCRWEKGTTEPSLDYLYKIGNALSVSVDYLIGLSDDPRPARGGAVVASDAAVAIGGGDANNHVEVHGDGAEAGKSSSGKCDCGLEEHREWFMRLKDQLEVEVIDEVSQALLAALLHVRQGEVCAFRRDGARRASAKKREEGGA